MYRNAQAFAGLALLSGSRATAEYVRSYPADVVEVLHFEILLLYWVWCDIYISIHSLGSFLRSCMPMAEAAETV